MDQQKHSGPADLQRRCICVIIDQLNRTGCTESIDNLPLPPSIVEQIEGIYQWKEDLAAVVLHSWSPLDRIRYDAIWNTPPFCDHFQWTKEENGSLKIDRRTTASAQLDTFDPATSSQSSKEFGFVLSATYCLEDHVRRLWPSSRPLDYSHTANSMVTYWSAAILNTPNYDNAHLFSIHPQRHGCSDFWLAVLQSYWSIAVVQLGDGFQEWMTNALFAAMDNGHKSCVRFLWAQHTEDMRESLAERSVLRTEMRQSLHPSPMRRKYTFLESTIRANEKEILIDIFNRFDSDDRRRAISYVLMRGGFFGNGTNLDTCEYLLDCMIVERVYFYSGGISDALCRSLSTIWDSLTPQRRAQITDHIVDLLRSAIVYGHLQFVMRIWNDEQREFRRFEILFREECVIFRLSCAKGHLELVRAFWEWASTDQRLRMIQCKDGDALKSAARNGHSSILRYLWENMDQRIAYQSVVSDGISRDSLSQLIIAIANKSDEGSHELEDFLAVLITTPSDGREPIYPLAPMREMLVAALLLDDGKALNVLVQRAKDRNDPSILRSVLVEFDNDQRSRLRSKLSTVEDIEVCGLETAELVTRVATMTVVQPVRVEQETGDGKMDDEDGDEDEEEAHGEMIDLTDEYYED